MRALIRTLTAVVLVGLVAAAAVILVTQRRSEPPTEDAQSPLIGFSLLKQPVATWRTTRADIGLPADAFIGEPFGSPGSTPSFSPTADAASTAAITRAGYTALTWELALHFSHRYN